MESLRRIPIMLGKLQRNMNLRIPSTHGSQKREHGMPRKELCRKASHQENRLSQAGRKSNKSIHLQGLLLGVKPKHIPNSHEGISLVLWNVMRSLSEEGNL